MINKIYELMVGRKDQSGKTHWMKVGACFPSKNGGDGFSVKLEVLPLPNEKGEVWISAFPPKDRDAQRVASDRARLRGDDGVDGDSIPF